MWAVFVFALVCSSITTIRSAEKTSAVTDAKRILLEKLREANNTKREPILTQESTCNDGLCSLKPPPKATGREPRKSVLAALEKKIISEWESADTSAGHTYSHTQRDGKSADQFVDTKATVEIFPEGASGGEVIADLAALEAFGTEESEEYSVQSDSHIASDSNNIRYSISHGEENIEARASDISDGAFDSSMKSATTDSFSHNNKDSTVMAENDQNSEHDTSKQNEENDKRGKSSIAQNADDSDSILMEEQVKELQKMGWDEKESRQALAYTGNDVVAAAGLLEQEEEQQEDIRKKTAQLVALGWEPFYAEVSLLECEGNVTAAVEYLEGKEQAVREEFEVNVQNMVASGFEEVVARQALLMQDRIVQIRESGGNVTISQADLQSLRPTRHKQSPTGETEKDTATPAAAGGYSQQDQKQPQRKGDQGKPAGLSQTTGKALAPVRKEDVVFEVTESNFQKVVLESPVPVFVDVYADWCGPCKQLGPLLEEAAVKAGGLFRLAKVNSDAQGAVAQALEVTGLPTVYAVVNGRFNDRFVGMLSTEQIQQFLVRAVYGMGARVQTDISDAELDATTDRMGMLAGLSSIGFRKKEKIFTLVDQAMELPGAFVSSSSSTTSSGSGTNIVLSNGVKTALAYIHNCSKDIRNPKFRHIGTQGRSFQGRVARCAAALKLLDIAGFKPTSTPDRDSATMTITNTPATGTATPNTPAAGTATATGTRNTAGSASGEGEALELVHHNAAVLTLVSQRVTEVLSARKFSRMKGSATPLKSRGVRSYAKKLDTPPAPPATVTAASATHPGPKQAGLGKKQRKHVSMIEKSDADNDGDGEGGDGDDSRVISRRVMKRGEVKAHYSHKPRRRGTGKIMTNTLFSSGIMTNKSKKNNEYFGGDSTVVMAGPEDEGDGDGDGTDSEEANGEEDDDGAPDSDDAGDPKSRRSPSLQKRKNRAKSNKASKDKKGGEYNNKDQDNCSAAAMGGPQKRKGHSSSSCINSRSGKGRRAAGEGGLKRSR